MVTMSGRVQVIVNVSFLRILETETEDTGYPGIVSLDFIDF